MKQGINLLPVERRSCLHCVIGALCSDLLTEYSVQAGLGCQPVGVPASKRNDPLPHVACLFSLTPMRHCQNYTQPIATNSIQSSFKMTGCVSCPSLYLFICVKLSTQGGNHLVFCWG